MVFQPESRFSATGFGFRPSPSEGSGYENEFSYTIHYTYKTLFKHGRKTISASHKDYYPY